MKFLLAVLLIISAQQLFGQPNQNNVAGKYLTKVQAGKIAFYKMNKSTTKSYAVKFSEVEKTGKIVEVNTYNNKGFMVKHIQYLRGDSMLTVYTYDNNTGDNTQVMITYGSGKARIKYIYAYDSCHNLIESKEYINDKPQPSSKMTYDDYDNRVETKIYNTDGSLSSMIMYKYDKEGRNIESQIYNSSGIQVSKDQFKYQANGTILYQYFFTANAACSGCYKYYKYDTLNNLIEERNFGENGTKSNYTIYRYDYDGILVEKTNYNPVNEPLMVYETVYDTEYTDTLKRLYQFFKSPRPV